MKFIFFKKVVKLRKYLQIKFGTFMKQKTVLTNLVRDIKIHLNSQVTLTFFLRKVIKILSQKIYYARNHRVKYKF